ncbi:Hypothetical protein A7982_08167 [Minicystis rosea]|nr:Hypothetical protein A7982_08167 [Minicystis rosea]
MLVKEIQPQLVRPPVTVRGTAADSVIERTFRFVRHGSRLWVRAARPPGARRSIQWTRRIIQAASPTSRRRGRAHP